MAYFPALKAFRQGSCYFFYKKNKPNLVISYRLIFIAKRIMLMFHKDVWKFEMLVFSNLSEIVNMMSNSLVCVCSACTLSQVHNTVVWYQITWVACIICMLACLAR